MKPAILARLVGAALLAAPLAAPNVASAQPASFKVGTASQGGTYFVYGSGWANLVSETLGVPGGGEVTGGPVQNAALVQTGDLDMGMVTMGPAFDAVKGQSALAPGLMHDKIRAIFPMYKTAFHIIALESSGIESIADIPDGARVGVGPAGGTPGTYWPRFFEALGKDVEVRNGGAADLAGQLQDGLIDVFAFASGIPTPAFAQVEAQVGVNFIGMTDAEVETLTSTQPVSAFTIPGGTYTSMEGDQNSVSMWNFAIASADLDEEFVYNVVKTVMENHDRMMTIHKAAEETIPENFDKNTFLPWHPGAVRWFEENGYDIPAELGG
jgi:TRAP transporter TAXI family solute receptor